MLNFLPVILSLEETKLLLDPVTGLSNCELVKVLPRLVRRLWRSRGK